MVAVNPIKLSGNWAQGYALDIHTTESTFLGHDEYGHAVFDTKRSAVGDLLYRLKYNSDKTALEGIIDTVADFLKNRWKVVDIIAALIPVPPSKIRDFQLVKIKETPQLKDVYEYDKRIELLNGAFAVRRNMVNGKSILLFDDLFRSGATLNAISKVLYEQGKVQDVYVLTLTRTRSKA